ncbi:hypothetical protein BBJ28_00020039 [Nothophytophthora sp. Chile5]|nr:hypothetical protein BBJ28_00020039 [Nothophytophthora sp. Chile5]
MAATAASASASPGATSPKKAGMPARHRTSAVPLDYSFMGLTTLSEMQQHEPVGGTKKAPDLETASSSSPSAGDEFVSSSAELSASLQASVSQATAGGSPNASQTTKKRAAPVSLRVNNNKLSHLNDMHEALRAVLDRPEALQWLDLSGNALTGIPPEVFAAYPELFTLHLHGNLLGKYADVDALARWLPRLHSLTLHGNPLEEKKHYRNYVIASFPTLQQLNFSAVTPGDRDKAETWARIYRNSRGKTRDS